MRFEQWLDPVDRRPRAQTRDTGKWTRTDPMNPHRGYAPHRRLAAHQSQVRGRRAERAAQPPAMHHAPYHPVRPSQQARSAVVIGEFQEFAHRRAAHTYSIETEGRYLLDSEPVLLACGPQAVDRAAGVAAVAKVIADHHMPRSQPLDNQFIDKGPRG